MYRNPLLLLVLCAGAALAANAKIDEANAKLKAGKHEEAITLLEGEYKAKPKADDVRLALANAQYEYGNFLMNNQSLPPFRKYPAALRAFRQSVALDKTNKKAQDNIKMIEDIYKSMGRPVPQ